MDGVFRVINLPNFSLNFIHYTGKIDGDGVSLFIFSYEAHSVCDNILQDKMSRG